MAVLTSRIQGFATFHVPTVHPMMVAKMVGTIDHISGGRFGLNIVGSCQTETSACRSRTDSGWAPASVWA